jgi:hypothetical protein
MNMVNLKLRDHRCIRMMINLVNQYEEANNDQKSHFIMEYELIKGRLESLSLICGWNYHENESTRINQMMNRDFYKKYT